MPVPASRTSAVSPSSSTSTQDVLPPYVTVSGPGVGNEPRQPQTLSWRDNSLIAPEDDDDADELVRVREQRERGHLDLALDAVDACREVAKVGRPPLIERDAPRALVGRNRLRIERSRLEAGEPVVERSLLDLGEAAAEHTLRGLVVVDEIPVGVGEERRRRQVRRELARQDQDEMLLPLQLHGPPQYRHSVSRGAACNGGPSGAYVYGSKTTRAVTRPAST